jgi:hypothetical protein
MESYLVATCGNPIYKTIYSGFAGAVAISRIRLKGLVGLPGFEPGTSCTPSKRASQAAPQPEYFSVHAAAYYDAETGSSETSAFSSTKRYPMRGSVAMNVGLAPGGSIFLRS